MRGSNGARTARARRLRGVENEAEGTLWAELRGRRLNGCKFVRQLPIGPYFVDFACRRSNLVARLMVPSIRANIAAAFEMKR